MSGCQAGPVSTACSRCYCPACSRDEWVEVKAPVKAVHRVPFKSLVMWIDYNLTKNNFYKQ